MNRLSDLTLLSLSGVLLLWLALLTPWTQPLAALGETLAADLDYPVKPDDGFSRCKGVRMVRTQDSFANGERPLIERLSLFTLAPLLREFCQMLQRLGHIGVIRSKSLFPNGKGSLQEGYRLRFLPL